MRNRLKYISDPTRHPHESFTDLAGRYCYHVEVCPRCGAGGKAVKITNQKVKTRQYIFFQVDHVSYTGGCEECKTIWSEDSRVPNTLRIHFQLPKIKLKKKPKPIKVKEPKPKPKQPEPKKAVHPRFEDTVEFKKWRDRVLTSAILFLLGAIGFVVALRTDQEMAIPMAVIMLMGWIAFKSSLQT